jgi:hypothetical protein
MVFHPGLTYGAPLAKAIPSAISSTLNLAALKSCRLQGNVHASELEGGRMRSVFKKEPMHEGMSQFSVLYTYIVFIYRCSVRPVGVAELSSHILPIWPNWAV